MLPTLPRWKQRFQNFDKAFFRLEEALALPGLDDLALNGLIQRFEFTIELAWKTLKDFLEEQGFLVASPRDTIRQGLASGFITEGQDWYDAIHYRNLLSHMYDEQHFRDAEQAIRNRFISIIRQLHQYLQSQL